MIRWPREAGAQVARRPRPVYQPEWWYRRQAPEIGAITNPRGGSAELAPFFGGSTADLTFSHAAGQVKSGRTSPLTPLRLLCEWILGP